MESKVRLIPADVADPTAFLAELPSLAADRFETMARELLPETTLVM
jgi:hypothetical protein